MPWHSDTTAKGRGKDAKAAGLDAHTAAFIAKESGAAAGSVPVSAVGFTQFSVMALAKLRAVSKGDGGGRGDGKTQQLLVPASQQTREEKLEEAQKNRKLNDLLDALEFQPGCHLQVVTPDADENTILEQFQSRFEVKIDELPDQIDTNDYMFFTMPHCKERQTVALALACMMRQVECGDACNHAIFLQEEDEPDHPELCLQLSGILLPLTGDLIFLEMNTWH